MRWSLTVLALAIPLSGCGRANTPDGNASRGLTVPPAVGAETRVALVIGNSNYANANLRLANPANDAQAMKRALEAAGFETIVKLDAKRGDFYKAVEQFGRSIGRNGHAVGLFYYAGHGVQADGVNYLIPVDAVIESQADLEANAFDVSRVLRAMQQAQNEMNIVILDACRDNPLPKTRGMTRGLARLEAPTGTFIAYAAGPGQAAEDGASGTNGAFTGELVKAMAEPGVPLEQMYKNVIQGVKATTANRQQPWYEASIQGNFYFHPLVLQPSPLPAKVDARQMEMDFWDSIKNSKNPGDFEAYLDKYPQGEFAALARNRLKERPVVPAKPAPQQPKPAAQQVASPAPVPPPARKPASTQDAGSAVPVVQRPDRRCEALADRVQTGGTLNEEERSYLRDKCR